MLIGLGAIKALGPNMPSFIKATAAAGIVFRLLGDDDKERIQTPDATTSDETSTCMGNIELRDLSFSYDSRPDRVALANVGLEFRRGTCTAVVGPSGAGKSTLISLLERWYQPTSGAVLLDGRDVSELDVKWLRRQIALVQQEPQLFNSSIFENIAHGLVGTDKENASAEEKAALVDRACDMARVSQFVKKLPDGVHTNVGDRGSLISGGQKQRIAIARALIGSRPVLLMDEATSALDGENSEVIESLLTASHNRTTIFISHKIVSAKRADRIVVMDKGKIAEVGTHSQLINAGGLYKRLYDAQVQLDAEVQRLDSKKWTSTQNTSEADVISLPEEAPAQHTELPELRKRSLFVNLWTIAGEQKRFLPIFSIGAAAAIVTAQIFPVQAILLGRVLQTFQQPIEQVQSGANFWALMFFVVGIGSLIAYAILGFFMTLFGMHLTTFYRLDYFRAVLLQRMEFFDRVASGAIVSRLSTDPANLHELISVNIGLLISIFFSVISGTIIALAFSWKFALVAIFGGMPLTFFAGFIRMKLDSSLAEATVKVFEESARFASDALSVIRTVKAFTMEEKVRQSYENHLSSTISKLYKQTAIIMLFFALSESLELLAAALAFWYGGKLLSEGETTTERFFTVFIAVIVGGQAAGALFGFSSSTLSRDQVDSSAC
jgi:ATP-binding cassette subfamily B (MDR/TAP) protein 1